MNIKRAFLAAVAVLMVPGFAMAQSTVTFSTSIAPPEAGTPDVTLTCNNGFPLQQTAPVGTTFVVQSIMVGAECTLAMATDLDSGWEADGYVCGPYMGIGTPSATPCVFTMDANTPQWHASISAVPTAYDYVVNVDWVISDNADPGIGAGATVTMECTGATNTTVVASASPNATMPVGVPGVVPESTCTATLSDQGSAVDVAGCAASDFTIGGGDQSCTITASAFYEGIPTLSQYGMAIMALLMLGVGFVGFRRFV